MAKKKTDISELQSDFFEFVASTHDHALEKEVWETEGQRSAPDDSRELLAYREAYFSEWCRRYPSGYCAKYSQERG